MSVPAAACGRRIYAAEAATATTEATTAATATEAQAAACVARPLFLLPMMAAASVARPLFLLPMAAACWLGSLGLFLFRSTAPPMAEAAADHNKPGGTGKKYNYFRLCLRARTYICYKSEEKKIPTNEKKKR